MKNERFYFISQLSVYLDWIKQVIKSTPVPEREQLDLDTMPNKDIVILRA